MSKINFYGSVSVTGILNIPNRKRLQQDLLKMKGSAVEVIIRKKNTRSTQANKYLWGVVYKEIEIRMRELGNDVNVDVVHDFCKDRFNATPLVGMDGEQIGTKGDSTADLNGQEFTEYVDKIIQFAAEYLGLAIPLPNSELTLNF